MRARVLALLLALFATPALADCPLDLGHGTGIVIFSEHFIIALRPEPLHLEVGDPFALILNVCTKGGEPADLVSVDAQLDEKNVIGEVTSIVSKGDGRYRAEGMVLTAPGSWEIGFNVRQGNDVERLTHDLIVN
jgi:hypothetical protein